MNNVVFSFLILGSLFALTPAGAQAAGSAYGPYNPYGPYGAAPSRSIVIDKLVGTKNQTKGGQTTFVNNLSPTDPRFTPGEAIMYQVKVKNTSDVVLQNIMVKDTIPMYLEAAEGPGTYDSTTKTITYTIARLNPGEEKTHTITTKVVTQANLPKDKGLMCVINKVRVSVDSLSAEDSAQACIEKQVLGVKQVPTAGPEYGILFSLFNITTLGAGLYLKQKTS